MGNIIQQEILKMRNKETYVIESELCEDLKTCSELKSRMNNVNSAEKSSYIQKA